MLHLIGVDFLTSALNLAKSAEKESEVRRNEYTRVREGISSRSIDIQAKGDHLYRRKDYRLGW